MPVKQPSAHLKTKTEKTSSPSAKPTIANSPVNSLKRRSSHKNLSDDSLNAGMSRQSNKQIPVVPTAEAVPIWLHNLYHIHRYSSMGAFLLVATTLVIYGFTVYSQELWSNSYRRLKNLQRYERQLNTTNATLTSKMAQEAEKPKTGLVSPTPQGTIFLPSASPDPISQSSKTILNSELQLQTPAPLGY
ncbi:hypothetical protein VB711_19675 [Cronbergia sp. UHCC 0137]|uniref:hypothetical protein n=1 Tax=Cronbergia sp. UHCC 0137 TaxID=3110239 RepID=UPI002B20D8A0|nr:hypothetical protein [Cronbergia sp. UHCC 0137]MEA5620048.1 hypothetical protein [Cronbergia sp. UHCC 0137]